jgi:cell shape-determining protein MreC
MILKLKKIQLIIFVAGVVIENIERRKNVIKKFNITLKEIAEAVKEIIEENENLRKQLAELEKKNDKLGTDLYNAENIVSDLQ